MEITLPLDKFKKAVNVINKINTKINNPSVKIHVTNGSLIASTDTIDTVFKAKIDTSILPTVEKDYTFFLHPTALAVIVNQITTDELTLKVASESVKVFAGSLRAELMRVSLENLYDKHLVVSDNAQAISVQAKPLAKALESVAPFVAAQEYQAAFKNVTLESKDQEVIAVATDGFKLAYVKVPCDTENANSIDALIPSNQIGLMSKLLHEAYKEDEETSVVIKWDERVFRLVAPDVQLNVSLAEGAFPSWRRVIPSSIVCTLTTDIEILKSAITRVASLVMTDQTMPNKQVKFKCKEGNVQLLSTSGQGQVTDTIEAEQTGEQDFTVKYNAKNLLLALKPLPAGDVTLQLSGETSPTLVTHDQFPEYLSLVVPLRTSD